MTGSSRDRNGSCSPLSRRSRGRIKPSAHRPEHRESWLQIRGNPPTGICKKIAAGARISGKSNLRHSGDYCCRSIASDYYTDDELSARHTHKRGDRCSKISQLVVTLGAEIRRKACWPAPSSGG